MKRLLLLFYVSLITTASLAQAPTNVFALRFMAVDTAYIKSNAINGTMFFNTVSQKLRLKKSGVWITVGEGSGGGGFLNPMTTDGDMIIGLSAGVPSRLGLGTNGSFLMASSTAPLYSTNFNWDATNARLNIGNGNSNSQATNNFVMGLNSSILTGNWNFVFGESNVIDRPSGTKGVGDNAILSGYANYITTTAAHPYIGSYENTVVGGYDNRSIDATQSTLLNGSHNITKDRASLAGGEWSLASGYGAFAFGLQDNAGHGLTPAPVQPVLAAGKNSFNFSMNSNSQTVGHGALAERSAILASKNANIPSTSPGSVVLGGFNIKARANDSSQVYVPKLNIEFRPPINDTLSTILAWDYNRQVKAIRRAQLLKGITYFESASDTLYFKNYLNLGNYDDPSVSLIANSRYPDVQANILLQVQDTTNTLPNYISLNSATGIKLYALDIQASFSYYGNIPPTNTSVVNYAYLTQTAKLYTAKQSFSGTTAAGINVGIFSTDPTTSLINGDAWFNNSQDRLKWQGASGSHVVNDANDLYGTTLKSTVVSSSLTSVGALASGSLAAGFTAVAAAQGGTGLTSITQGGIIYASAANTYSVLAKNTTATRYLSNTGTSNNPAWAQIDLSTGVTGTLPLASSKIYNGAFSTTGSATTTFVVTIGTTQANATYKVAVTPTSSTAAAPFYVTSKSTTQFTITYLSGLTGTVSFDWTITP